MKINLTILLVCFTLSLFGQEQHALDNKFDDCIEENTASTYGTNVCLQQAMKIWDVQLNAIYKDLRANLTEVQKENLKASQLHWIKFRDAEYAFIESQTAGMEGTMWPNKVLNDKLRILKKRVQDLEKYQDFYSTMR